MTFKKHVYLVASKRSPFLKSRHVPGPFAASDMAVWASRSMLLESGVLPEWIDNVAMGCVMPSELEANIARLIALRLGCSENIPAYSVQRNCASGMQAIDSAFKDIQLGRSSLAIAGGCEAMSRAPLIYRSSAVRWFSAMAKARRPQDKLGQLMKLRPAFFAPIIALLKGLTDPLVGMTMPQTAEQLAFDFDIDREAMDQFSLISHQRAAQARRDPALTDRVDMIDANGYYYDTDNGVRADASLDKLQQLKPFVDKRFGLVTAGNSSQVTDGASVLLLAGEEALKKYNLEPIARIVDCHWAGLNPRVMGLGPVMATVPLLENNGLGMEDVDYWEINEAFATQVLACLRAFESVDFAKEHFGRHVALGSIAPERLNACGGAIALGHPVGASGARIVSQLVKTLHRKQAKRGVASICIGGGQGGAMLVEGL